MKQIHYVHLSKVFILLVSLLPMLVFAQVTLDKTGTYPASIRFEASNQPTVSSFFEEFQNVYPLSEDNQMEELSTATDRTGTHYRYDQYYKGIQVLGAQYVLHEKNGAIWLANGHVVKGIEVDVNPSIAEQTALSAALKDVGAKVYMWEKAENEAFLKKEQNNPNATFAPKGELFLTSGREDLTSENIRLVYRFDVYAEQPLERYWVDVDAKTGEVINKTSRIHTGDVPGSGDSYYDGNVSITVDDVGGAGTLFTLNEATTRGAAINTYNMNNGTNYGAATQFTSTTADGPWDGVGVNGHWGAEATYDYYFDKHSRNSLDDAGFALNSYVHRGVNYNNAFWDGTRMTYGDGDGVNYTPLVSLDVVGHELTHGVTNFSSNLIYSNESGGLNESFSDIFGNLVEFEMLGAPPSGGSWRIGEQITTDGLGIRNMENPNEFNNPDCYLGDFWFYNEVHNTSGVQNFWFYLLVEGGTGTNDVGYSYNVTGIGLDDAAAIAYHNNTSYLFPSATYYDARIGAIACAESLFGVGSQQALSTEAAWDAVGVFEIFEAEIDVYPASLTFDVPPDGTDSDIITISNIGDVGAGAPDLVWTILSATTPDPPVNVMTELLNKDTDLLEYQEVVYDKSNVQNNKAKELSKLIDTGTGGDDSSEPDVLSAGGPDAFGYSFTDSDEAGGPAFSWTDITTTGTALGLGDDAFQEITIPFNFPFYGDVKTSVKVSSNGYLTFGIDGTDFSNDPIPNATDPNDIICPFWDDLSPNIGGSIHYLSTSTQFIVQYTNIPRWSDGSSLMTFQVILNDDGSILFQYYSMVGLLHYSTIGIENATGDDGLQVAYNDAVYIHNNLAVKISLPEPCPWITSVLPISGTLSPGNSDDVTVSVDATGLAEGTYECELIISSNASNVPLVTVPVTMIVAACEAPTVTTKDITVELDADGNASIVALDILEPTTFTNLTSTANWLGFVGVFVDGDFVAGDVTALGDVKSTIDAGADEITLQPNFNTYYPDVYGDPILQGSTYIEEFGTLAGGASFSFTGTVTSNTLDPRYQAYAFIRIFDGAWQFLGEIDDPLVEGNDFSVQYNNTLPDAYIIQYGFTVEGTTGAYDDEASLGNAVVQGMTLNVAPYSACGLESVVLSQTVFDCNDVGANDVTVTATDINGEVTSGTATVTVKDSDSPVLTAISTPITLWPPNHKYETIDMSQLFVSVEDNCGELAMDDVYITSVSSDEVEDANGNGDGKTVNDIVINSDCNSVDLRKERSGNGNGRVYTIYLAVDDGNGNTGTASCQVHVPHNKGGIAIDDGMAYEVECGEKSSFIAVASEDIELKNYPNPFKANTTIEFSLIEANYTKLVVYNSLGIAVATLYDGMAEAEQVYKVEFNAIDLSGGVYFYHLQSGENVNVMKKMMLIK